MEAINRIKAVLAEKQMAGKWNRSTENTVSRCANKVGSHLLKTYLKSRKCWK